MIAGMLSSVGGVDDQKSSTIIAGQARSHGDGLGTDSYPGANLRPPRSHTKPRVSGGRTASVLSSWSPPFLVGPWTPSRSVWSYP